MTLLLVAAMLSGCADAPELEGGHCETAANPDPSCFGPSSEPQLRGVVVDEAIVPLSGATVVLDDQTTTTGDDGLFVFTGLAPGFYTVTASHEFYDTVTVQGEALGDGLAQVVRIQLTRTIFDEPYIETEVFDGFLACSSNVGGVIAEECGEGVGVPGYGRIGTHPNNQPQVEFFAAGPSPQTIQGEIIWTPTLRLQDGLQSGDFTTIMATHHVCDPICGYEAKLDDKVGGSPMVMRTDDGDQGGAYFTQPDVAMADAGITDETPIAIFVWQSDQDLAGVQLEQPFTVYRTVSFVLPLPEGWSLAEGDEPPF